MRGIEFPKSALMQRLKNDTSSEKSGMCVRIYLITTSELDIAKTKYATLSYCWGGPQKFQLNDGSENMLKGGISATVLPKTLCDAVEVTRNLGIRWITSSMFSACSRDNWVQITLRFAVWKAGIRNTL